MSNLLELLQQAEDLINRGENAEALGVIATAKQFIQAPVIDEAETAATAEDESDAPPSIKDRLREHLGNLVGLICAITVVKDSIDSGGADHARWRVLGDAVERMEDLYTALDEVADDARQPASKAAVGGVP